MIIEITVNMNKIFRRFNSNLICELLLWDHSQGPPSIFCKKTEKTHCSISREVLNPEPTGKRKALIERPLQRCFQNNTLQGFERDEMINHLQVRMKQTDKNRKKKCNFTNTTYIIYQQLTKTMYRTSKSIWYLT